LAKISLIGSICLGNFEFGSWIRTEINSELSGILFENHLILVAVRIFPFLEVCFVQHTIQLEFLKLLVKTIHH